jgi:hypothetical protein
MHLSLLYPSACQFPAGCLLFLVAWQLLQQKQQGRKRVSPHRGACPNAVMQQDCHLLSLGQAACTLNCGHSVQAALLLLLLLLLCMHACMLFGGLLN